MSDHLGSVRLVVDAQSGEVVYSLTYDAFGRVLAQRGDFELPFGFAGGLYDPATGLVRFGARDYDPRTGRWTAKDPIGFAGGDSNLYGYVLADPVNGIDPRGLWSISFGGASMGIDISTVIYDSNRGYFPDNRPSFAVTPTLVGIGFSLEFEGNRTPYYDPEDDVWHDIGLGRYTGYGTNQDETRHRINFGASAGLPYAKSESLTKFRGDLRKKISEIKNWFNGDPCEK